jgi:hypothetical protein
MSLLAHSQGSLIAKAAVAGLLCADVRLRHLVPD